MATIQASIQLKDGMSPALRAIEKTLTNVVATFDRLDAVLNRSLGTGKIDSANRQLGTTQQKVNKIEQEVNQAAAAERRFQSEVTKTLGAIYRQQTNQVRLTAAIRKTPPVIQQVAVAQEKVNNNIRKGATLMNGLVGKVTALAGAYMGVSELFPCYEQFPGMRPQIKVVLEDLGQSPRVLSFLSPRRWSCH